MKQEFLDIYQTTLFRVRKLKNTHAMRVSFFLKVFKIESRSPKYKKKEKKSFVSEMIASEVVALNCLY